MQISISNDEIKKYVDGLSDKTPLEAENLDKALFYLQQNAIHKELDEELIKEIHAIVSEGITKPGIYRKRKIAGKTNPEEILAKMVELIDWVNSLEAKETHPILVAGIVKSQLETICPFEEANFASGNLISRLILLNGGFGFKGFNSPEDYYANTKQEYDKQLYSYPAELTHWLEYFTDGLYREIANIKEKVALLARDIKVAKASGRIKLTDRQERIVEYLQDYGLLQNKDFTKVFPGVSEDSILRDLKTLISKEIVVKTGSTKSSRYELS